MGAKIDLPLILKVVALICCAIAVGLNVAATTDSYAPRVSLVSNSLIFAVGAYIIILSFFLGWTIFQSEVNQKFAGIILICGFLWNVGAGIGVIIFKSDYGNLTDTFQLIGGILGLAAGCVMFADGLHNMGVF